MPKARFPVIAVRNQNYPQIKVQENFEKTIVLLIDILFSEYYMFRFCIVFTPLYHIFSVSPSERVTNSINRSILFKFVFLNSIFQISVLI